MNKRGFNIRLSVRKFCILTMIYAVVLSACSGTSREDEHARDSNAVYQSGDVSKDVEKIIYPLPTPYQVSEMLNGAGAGYIFNVSNPVENVDRYFTEKQKALNLGVYGADLSYASTYNKSKETQFFLTCTQQLTIDLGINSALNQGLIERVEANINNKDSLHNIISESFYDTFDYLNKNGKGSISVLILAGGWIEGMYLSTQLAIITKNNPDILRGIGEQKDTLEKLLTILRNYKDDPNVTEVILDLEKIDASFQGHDVSTIITVKRFDNLCGIIDEVRSSIVE